MTAIVKPVMRIFRLVRSYFINTSLHGFRFIAQKGRHWTERVLWIVLCALSWVGSAFLIQASWEAFQNNAVSFVVETTYLHANTTFPSITLCEDENLPPVYTAANEMFGEDHDCNLDEILRELAYFKGSAYYVKEFCTSGELECPKGNFSNIVKKVRSSCQDMMHSCSWNGKPFDCCKHFTRTETELGPCFTFGSRFERQLKERGDPDYIETTANRQTELPNIRVEVYGSVKGYMHPEADVPFLNTLTTDVLQTAINQVKSYAIVVTDIENPPEVRELTISQRKCRFADENNLSSADYYSYSACVVECRRDAQLKVCNCTSHFMPKSKPELHCGLEGILCLNNFYTSLSVQKTKWGEKDGLVCDCLPGCSDPEYNAIITGQEYIYPETNLSVLEVRMERFPTERYKRNVVRGRLDLVVSMGSAAGLFVGASLLSFVEFFYFFLFRTHTAEELEGEGGDDDDDVGRDSAATSQIARKPVKDALPYLR